MRDRYIVDTDWVIHYLNGHSQIISVLQGLLHEGLALSLISLAELYEGLYGSTDPEGSERSLDDFLRAVTVIVGLDQETCRQFGRERARLRAANRMIGDFDLLIGCTALRHHLTLLTNNRRHFEALDGLEIVSR